MSREDAKVWYLLGEAFWEEQGCTQNGLLGLIEGWPCLWFVLCLLGNGQGERSYTETGFDLPDGPGRKWPDFSYSLCRFQAGGGRMRLDNCQRSNVKNRVRLFFFF